MVHRRSMLKLGAAGVACTFLRIPGPALAAGWTNPGMPLYRAVFDERFEESVSFADELRRHGITTVSGSDVVRLWYRDLHIQPGPTAAIAGLTDRTTLFCLEELARSAGMRVVYRIDHLIDASERVEHDPAGPRAVVTAARRLGPRSGFGRDMAVFARRFSASERQYQDTTAMKRTGPYSPGHKIALVSWIIA